MVVLFEIKGQLNVLKQNNMSVTDYYSALVQLWQQIDLYEVHLWSWSCNEDARYYQKFIETERVYKFLFGLNTEFEEVRSRNSLLLPAAFHL